MLNIVSLISGALAWIFAVFAITVSKAYTSHRNTFVSFTLCTISLLFQLFEINRSVLIGDFSAIEDTIRAVIIAGIVLITITAILNLIAILKTKNK